ncbi:MAG: hypothetical protein OEV87_11055 [Phycisphaerae bacterium]|nr:hypothetical protein [Phycisphaerae bacterium]
MGLDMMYVAGNERLSFRLSNNDIEVCELLRKKNLEKEIDDIFNVPDFGESCSIEKNRLSESINNILHALTNNPELLPCIFSTKEEVPRGSGKYSTGGWATCGLKINNEMYDLEYGLDKCELTKKWQDEDGKIHLGEPKDVRDLSIIKQDPDSFSGDVIITKRKPMKLVKNLKQIESFLSKTDAKVVNKILG